MTEAEAAPVDSSGPQLRYPFNALVSFHYYRKHDLSILTRAGLRLIGDSGAFSAASTGAPITVAEFAEWATRWREHLCWIASLDVIGDSEGTWRNYRALRDTHGIDVVPTLHAGDDKHLLDRYAGDGVDFVGLGGLVPHRGRPKATMPWLVDVMRYARDRYPTMRFHGWGVTNPTLIKALPWYSVDSSNLGSPYRFARLVLFDPAGGTWHQANLDGADVFRIEALLRRHYGVRAREVTYSTPANRRLLVRLMARSYQLVEDYLRKRHGAISGPSYGIREHHRPDGPLLHGALDGPYRIERDVEMLGDPATLDPAMRAGQAGRDPAPPPGPAVHAADQMQYLSLVAPVGDDAGPRGHGVVDPKSPPHRTAAALGMAGVHVHGTLEARPATYSADALGTAGPHVHATDGAWQHVRLLGSDQ